MHVSFNIFPNSGHILHYGKLGSENVIILKLAHQNIILPIFFIKISRIYLGIRLLR